MDKPMAELLANEIRKEIQNNPLHFPDVCVEVVRTVGVGWMIQIY